MQMIKLISWNVNGIRAVYKKGFLDYLYKEQPDILCVQEIKARPDQLSDDLLKPKGYEIIWHPAERAGYSGVATFYKLPLKSKSLTIDKDEFDCEGRVIQTEFENFILFNVYFPNGQKDDVRLDYKCRFYHYLLKYCEQLRSSGKKIIISGDFNTAHKEIDLANPKANEKYSGFLPCEREILDLYIQTGYVDTFRLFNKEPEQYSWWSYRFQARQKNIGWRIDYHFASKELLPNIKDASIQQSVLGSDHCPVTLNLDF